MRLSLAGVSVEIGPTPIISACDLVVDAGENVGLVGPNGSGKTTLLKVIYRSLRPAAGTVLLGGEDVAGLRQRDIARRAAVVAQESPSDFDFCVEDTVALGRAPYQGPFDRETRKDQDAVTAALDRVGMLSYRRRAFSTLSGGGEAAGARCSGAGAGNRAVAPR